MNYIPPNLYMQIKEGIANKNVSKYSIYSVKLEGKEYSRVYSKSKAPMQLFN